MDHVRIEDSIDTQDNDEEMLQMLVQMEIKFKDQFTDASPSAKQDIKVCLDALSCLSQQNSPKKSCSQLETSCVIDIPPKLLNTESYFTTNSVDSRVSQLGCKIETLLCQLAGSNSCDSNLEDCIEDSLDYFYGT